MNNELINYIRKNKFLNLGDSDFDPIELSVLPEIFQIRDLKKFSLFKSNLGLAGAKIIAENLDNSDLRALKLYSNNLGPKGAEIIAEKLIKTKITTFDLSCNNLGPTGVKNLAKYLKGTKVSTLGLSDNNLGLIGIENLGPCLKETNITSLDLSYNDLRDEGAKIIFQNLHGTNIVDLNLDNNLIHTLNLTQNLQGTNIKRINLKNNTMFPIKGLNNLLGSNITEILGFRNLELQKILESNLKTKTNQLIALGQGLSKYDKVDCYNVIFNIISFMHHGLVTKNNKGEYGNKAADLVVDIKIQSRKKMLIKQWGDILCGGTKYLEPNISMLRNIFVEQKNKTQTKAAIKIQNKYKDYKSKKI